MLKDHFYTFDLESFPIHSNYGHGIDIEFDNTKYRTEAPFNKEGYRDAEFRITSYQNVGGIHFYGSVSFNTSTREVGTDTFVYRPHMEIPIEAKSQHINILRPIEEWEAKSGEEVMPGYSRYKLGDLSNAFYSEQSLIDTFKNYVNQIFSGKWEIHCDYWDLAPEKILIDN